MNEQPLAGGCLCGKVRYEIKASAKSVEHCHCSQCRRAHGAFYASGALFDASAVEIVSGEENLSIFESSTGNWRKFCSTCGCHLFMTVDDFLDEIYVWVASLDGGAHPGHPADKEVHIFVGSKVPWEQVADGLPQFDQLPSNIGIGQSN